MYTRAKRAAGERTTGPALEASPARLISESKPFSVFLVQAFWVLMIFEVDIFLSAITGGPFYRIPLVFAPILTLPQQSTLRIRPSSSDHG
jgi:hypothetical protein